ncbi:hypothetical protein QQ045_016980 [Rhodiola kirilowii]
MKGGRDSTSVDIPETSADARGEAPLFTGKSSSGGIIKHAHKTSAQKKGLAIFDLILRICALVTCLAAATAMGTAEQTLPFTTQFFKFDAGYDDMPGFMAFVICFAIAGCYFLLSLPFSIISIIRPHAAGPRLLLVIFDTIVLGLTMAAAAAATAIVYLAHNGNSSTNWLPVCQQFGDFCQATSGAVVGSFIAVAVIALLVILSGAALRRH